MIPLAGVLLAHWPIYPLMLLFWAENVIIGLYTIPKIILASGEPPEPGSGEKPDRLAEELTPAGYPLFFMVHYGMFTFVHFLFLYGIFGGSHVGKEMLHVYPDTLFPTLWAQFSRNGLFLALIALAVSHGVSFWTNYVKPQRYLELSKKAVMMAPYSRVILLHLVLIGSALAIQKIGPGPLPLLVLVLVKTGMDLAAHLKEHQSAPAADTPVVMALTEAIAARNSRPLAHYLGSWRLAPDQGAAPGWCNGVEFSQNGTRLHLRLAFEGAAAAGIAPESSQQVALGGDVNRVEFIEARLRGNGRERILRFSESNEFADRIDLVEIQQPLGRPREMQTRNASFARSGA